MPASFRSRPLALSLSLVAALVFLPAVSQAQSAQSITEQARDRMIDMYQSVDHFMVKTEFYTSYNRVVEKDGEMQMETQTESMRGDASGRTMGGSTLNTMSQLDAVGQHGTYVGTQTVSGINCHVIRLDDPSKVDAQMSGADDVTYYFGASDHLIHGMDMTMEDGTGMEMRMVDYRDYDGIMYPSRMEMTMVQQSEEQKQQMKELEEQLKQMPESMRKRMQKQIEQARSMMAGEPVVITIEEVVVNGPLPEGIFDN
jgi:flagellar hook-basal body complex protein FliE